MLQSSILRRTDQPNLVDVAVIRLEERGDFFKGHMDGAADGQIKAVRRPTPDDIGRIATCSGRTTGTTFAPVRAIDIDGVAVGTARGLVRFNEQMSLMSENGPFSLPGDSGSAIMIGSDLIGLLHSGGADSRGSDWTYACYADNVSRLTNTTPVFA